MWAIKKKRGEIMLVFAGTDTGKAREMNQDYYHISDNNQNMRLCILADRHGRI